MKKKITLWFILLSCLNSAFAQKSDLNKTAAGIEKEAKALYNSEWASWYGTDIFLAKCKDKDKLTDGFLSYETPTGRNNIFYSKGDKPMVVATTAFGADFDENNYKLDTVARPFTPLERELYELRTAARKRIKADTTFKFFKNADLNPVPLIQNGIKKVYVLTGPQLSGVVIFGNDYLMDFDKDNKVTEIKKLHKSLIPAYYTIPGADSSKIQVSAMHSHLPQYDEFMTVTDICTLMLYEKFTTWQQYTVISKDYVSIWDCKKNSLLILTGEAFKKIMDDRVERTKKE